jgi:hypothetical protein
VRILGGWLADRADRPKWVAFLGYALSAVTKVALIAASTPAASLGRAFGVHRALATARAAIGLLLALGILWFVPGDYSAVFIASLAAATPPSPPSPRLLGQRRFDRLMLAAWVLGPLTTSDDFLYLSLNRRDDLAATWFPLPYVGTNVAYLALVARRGALTRGVRADRLRACRVR